MKFFLILLTVSLSYFSISFGEEVYIIAKVNQTPITNIDLQDRIEILTMLFPQFKKYSTNEQTSFALQNLIQSALKQSYIERVEFTVTDEEQKIYNAISKETLKKIGVKNVQAFIAKYPDFFNSEARWQGVVEQLIKPSLNITDAIIETVHAQKPEFSKEDIREILIQQQIESQTRQLLESMKGISVIEITTNKL